MHRGDPHPPTPASKRPKRRTRARPFYRGSARSAVTRRPCVVVQCVAPAALGPPNVRPRPLGRRSCPLCPWRLCADRSGMWRAVLPHSARLGGAEASAKDLGTEAPFGSRTPDQHRSFRTAVPQRPNAQRLWTQECHCGAVGRAVVRTRDPGPPSAVVLIGWAAPVILGHHRFPPSGSSLRGWTSGSAIRKSTKECHASRVTLIKQLRRRRKRPGGER